MPPDFLNDLPPQDQQAIAEAVGKPLRLIGYDEDGRAELEFADVRNVSHSIFVDPRYISPHE